MPITVPVSSGSSRPIGPAPWGSPGRPMKPSMAAPSASTTPVTPRTSAAPAATSWCRPHSEGYRGDTHERFNSKTCWDTSLVDRPAALLAEADPIVGRVRGAHRTGRGVPGLLHADPGELRSEGTPGRGRSDVV